MKLISINLGRKETLKYSNQTAVTGIFKRPVTDPVTIGILGLEGDYIASQKHHGGPDQAVYVYGAADYAWWSDELGRELAPGTFGENLTISDLVSDRFSIGDRLIFNGVILEVTAARIPCETFARRMEDANFVTRFRAAERPGLYCRVIQEGTVRAGEDVILKRYPGETVTLIENFRAFYDTGLGEETLRRLLDAPIASRSRMDLEEKLTKLLKGNNQR